MRINRIIGISFILCSFRRAGFDRIHCIACLASGTWFGPRVEVLFRSGDSDWIQRERGCTLMQRSCIYCGNAVFLYKHGALYTKGVTGDSFLIIVEPLSPLCHLGSSVVNVEWNLGDNGIMGGNKLAAVTILP